MTGKKWDANKDLVTGNKPTFNNHVKNFLFKSEDHIKDTVSRILLPTLWRKFDR